MKLLVILAVCVASSSPAPTAASIGSPNIQFSTSLSETGPGHNSWEAFAATFRAAAKPLVSAPTPLTFPEHYWRFGHLPPELWLMVGEEEPAVEFEELIETCKLAEEERDNGHAALLNALVDCAIYRGDYPALDALWHRSYLMKGEARAKMEQWRKLRVDHGTEETAGALSGHRMAEEARRQLALEKESLRDRFVAGIAGEIAFLAFSNDERLIDKLATLYSNADAEDVGALREAYVLYRAARDASPQQLRKLKQLLPETLVSSSVARDALWLASYHPSDRAWNSLRGLCGDPRSAITPELDLVTNKRILQHHLDWLFEGSGVAGPTSWLVRAASADNSNALEVIGRHVKDLGRHVSARALQSAAQTGAIRAARYLVFVLGVDVEAKDSDSFTALMSASFGGQLELIDFLVEEAGADLNALDGDGCSALIQDLAFNESRNARYLLQKGADPRVGRWQGRSALQLAGNAEIIHLLLNRILELEAS